MSECTNRQLWKARIDRPTGSVAPDYRRDLLSFSTIRASAYPITRALIEMSHSSVRYLARFASNVASTSSRPLIAPLPHRAVLEISGPDAKQFLKGLSCKDVESTNGGYSGFLNASVRAPSHEKPYADLLSRAEFSTPSSYSL